VKNRYIRDVENRWAALALGHSGFMTHTRALVDARSGGAPLGGQTQGRPDVGALSRSDRTWTAAADDEILAACVGLRDGIVLTRDLERLGAGRKVVSRACRRGRLVRLRWGAYATAETWQGADDATRHLLRVRAAALTLEGQVFSHASAGALLRLPRVGPWPHVVHTYRDRATGGRSTAGIVRHCDGGEPGTLVVGECTTTDGPRTVVDLARTERFATALVAADHAVRSDLATVSSLARAFDEHPARSGRNDVARVLAHVDPRLESPGESLSRARMIELGALLPDLQVDLSDGEGHIGRVDFLWHELGLVGEFDGRVKYTRGAVLGAREPGDVVWDEKRREDRVRRLGLGMLRWTWDDALDLVRFARLLERAGVPLA
jgi:hypothetical protein